MYKKLLFIIAAIFFFSKSYAQLNIGFHQSNLPFIGVGYELGDNFYPELRVGTDQYIEDLGRSRLNL